MCHGLKLLIGCFVFATAFAIFGCIWENYHPRDNVIRLYACEVHADRDMESVVQEMIRDNETPGDRMDREVREALPGNRLWPYELMGDNPAIEPIECRYCHQVKPRFEISVRKPRNGKYMCKNCSTKISDKIKEKICGKKGKYTKMY